MDLYRKSDGAWREKALREENERLRHEVERRKVEVVAAWRRAEWAEARLAKVRRGKAYFRTCCPKCKAWFKDWIWLDRLGKGAK